jgi:hypothetical protein
MFPGAAEIKAASFEGFWRDLKASDAAKRLPVFTGEVGDTWVYGVASDPWKVAAARGLQVRLLPTDASRLTLQLTPTWRAAARETRVRRRLRCLGGAAPLVRQLPAAPEQAHLGPRLRRGQRQRVLDERAGPRRAR